PRRRPRGARWRAARDLGERRRGGPSARWGVARRPAQRGGPLAVRHEVAPATQGTGFLTRPPAAAGCVVPSSLPQSTPYFEVLGRSLSAMAPRCFPCRAADTVAPLTTLAATDICRCTNCPVRGEFHYGSTDVGVGRRGDGPALGPDPRRRSIMELPPHGAVCAPAY